MIHTDSDTVKHIKHLKIIFQSQEKLTARINWNPKNISYIDGNV